MNKCIFIASAAMLCLCGCATQLSESAQKIQVVNAEQKKENCAMLGLVTSEVRLGPDKAGNALKKAYNEVAKKGGNAIYIITSSMDALEGANVTAEALRCK